jgi:hypothetical protein
LETSGILARSLVHSFICSEVYSPALPALVPMWLLWNFGDPN